MKIIDKLFGSPTMTVAEEKQISTGARLDELKARHAELRQAVRSGTATEDEIVEEETLMQRVLAAEQVANAASGRAGLEKIRRESDERIARVEADMDEIADLIPRLELALGGLKGNIDKIMECGMAPGDSRTLDSILGVPIDFAEQMLRAIRESAPLSVWDFSGTGPLDELRATPERPKLKTVLQRAPVFPGDNAPPPGYTGVWDYRRGEPVQELAVFHIPPAEDPAA